MVDSEDFHPLQRQSFSSQGISHLRMRTSSVSPCFANTVGLEPTTLMPMLLHLNITATTPGHLISFTVQPDYFRRLYQMSYVLIIPPMRLPIPSMGFVTSFAPSLRAVDVTQQVFKPIVANFCSGGWIRTSDVVLGI